MLLKQSQISWFILLQFNQETYVLPSGSAYFSLLTLASTINELFVAVEADLDQLAFQVAQNIHFYI